jgi:hypothetical protein
MAGRGPRLFLPEVTEAVEWVLHHFFWLNQPLQYRLVVVTVRRWREARRTTEAMHAPTVEGGQALRRRSPPQRPEAAWWWRPSVRRRWSNALHP